ncbi:MAG: NHLP bacteriocin export ABC transporter permease/ATPase subunit [Planctomycetes bacterium]|nr:NHLP bacteriocin export ABC transporter permease/ATPase subunit [Planctomycetota bacterium]
MTDTEKLNQVLSQEGAPLDVGANQPFLLDDADSAWLIQSGLIDIFSVDVEDGRAAGVRSHLCRLEAGDLLLGMEHRGEAGALAVAGIETTLVTVPKARLKALAQEAGHAEAAAASIEKWTSALLSGLLRPGLMPKDAAELEPGKELEIDSGQSARVEDGLLWAAHSEGTLRFAGREDISPVRKDCFFPVSDTCWLAAVEKTTIRTAETRTLVSNGAIWPALDGFHEQALACIRQDRLLSVQHDRERMSATAEVDELALENVSIRLTSVLAPSVEKYVRVSDDMLLEACRLVGKAAGIQVQLSRASTRGAKHTDILENIAKASRFRTRKVLLTDDWWRQDAGPMLAYLAEDRRPVALLPTSPGRYVLHDPSEKTHQRVTARLADKLEPFAFVFYRTFPDRPITGKEMVRFGLFTCGRDIWRLVVMGIAAGLLALVTPIVTNLLFDTVIPSANLEQLATIVFALIVSALAVAAFHVVRAFAILRIEAKMDGSLEAAVWDRLLNLPLPFFRDYTAGDLALRASGIGMIRQMLAGAVAATFLDSIFSVFSVALLFYYSWVLALVALGILVVAGLISMASIGMQYHYQRPLFNIQGRIQGLVLQFIYGMSKLRVAGAEKRALSTWAEMFADQKRLSYKARKVNAAFAMFVGVLPLFSSGVIFGAFAFSHSPSLREVSVGDFLAFTAALTNVITGGVSMIMSLAPALLAGPLAERIMPIVRAEPEVSVNKAQPSELSGRIEVSHVSFRYTKDGPQILKDVSLTVKPGEFVAIVGPSGSGKSTLFRLLLGFEFPNTGSVYYDQQDISGLDIQALRRQIGVVLQTSKVMPGSIFENIIGASLLTVDDAWEAARMCGLEDDIKDMPMGMHTVVAEGGTGLSGGQRQRILIARAVVHRPRILFFDEATSALDNRTQAIVSRSLEQLNATRIVIAHRLSTIINADRIYVLVNGQIVQAGSYQELVNQKGVFADLAKRQVI